MASTVIHFRILPPLYALNRAMIVVPTRGGEVKFNFKITPSGQSPWTGHGNVTVLGDDIGAMHNTIVEAEFPTIVSSDEAQGAAVRLLNVILGYYRSAAKVPQIRSIALIHAGGVQFVQTPDTGEPVRGSHFKGLSLRPDGEDAGVGDGDVDVIKEVQEGVRGGPVAVWVSLYQDALADHSVDNYRSALAHLYMAFEMRAALTCRHVGTSKVGADGVEAFLEPKEKDEGRPTIFKIIKQTRDWSATGPSKTQLERELGQLWKHRNAVMHGKHIDIQASDVDEALVPFHSLVAWLVSAQPKLD